MKVSDLSEVQVRGTIGPPLSPYASRFAGRIAHDRDFGSHVVRVGFDVEADRLAIVTAIHRKKGRWPTTIVFDRGSGVLCVGGPGS
jgi:hypothetical protein